MLALSTRGFGGKGSRDDCDTKERDEEGALRQASPPNSGQQSGLRLNEMPAAGLPLPSPAPRAVGSAPSPASQRQAVPSLPGPDALNQAAFQEFGLFVVDGHNPTRRSPVATEHVRHALVLSTPPDHALMQIDPLSQ